MRAGWPWQGHPLPAGCLLPVDPEGPGDDGDHTVVFMVGKVLCQSKALQFQEVLDPAANFS